jgi:hypothetical protein
VITHCLRLGWRQEVFTALAPFTDRLGADYRQVLTRLLDAVSEASTVDNRPD